MLPEYKSVIAVAVLPLLEVDKPDEKESDLNLEYPWFCCGLLFVKSFISLHRLLKLSARSPSTVFCSVSM